MYCKVCGNAVSKEALRCPACGATIERDEAERTGAALPPRLIAAAYIAGALLPLFGWVIAIYLFVKGQIIHGVNIAVLSSFMLLAWIGFSEALEPGASNLPAGEPTAALESRAVFPSHFATENPQQK